MGKMGLLTLVCCAVGSVFAAEPVIEFKFNEGSGIALKETSGKKVAGRVLFDKNTKWDEGREEGSKALYFTTPLKQRRGGGSSGWRFGLLHLHLRGRRERRGHHLIPERTSRVRAD